jgi:hypothetical protein
MPSGFITCTGDGLIHRTEQVACINPQGTGTCNQPGGTCEDDLGCADQDYGRCNEDLVGFCSCEYGCETDDDCANDQLCACAGVVGQHAICVQATCDSANACAEGELCALATDTGICEEQLAKIACIAPDAECHGNDDCSEGPCEGQMNTLPHICWPINKDWVCKAPQWCSGDC